MHITHVTSLATEVQNNNSTILGIFFSTLDFSSEVKTEIMKNKSVWSWRIQLFQKKTELEARVE